MRDEIRSLKEENAALRERLNARVKADRGQYQTVTDAIDSVCRNIYHLNVENKERVLLAAAVLFGIVKPNEVPAKRYKCVDCGVLAEDTYGGLCLTCFRVEGALEKAQLSSDAPDAPEIRGGAKEGEPR